MNRRNFLFLVFSLALIKKGCTQPKKYLGKIDELKNKETYHEFNGNKVYLNFEQSEPLLLNLTCTHKKCTVERKNEYWICPCHKGKFDKFGKRISGKPPRDLYLYQYEILDNDIWIINRYLNEDI